MHTAPDPAWIPLAINAVPMLENACDVAAVIRTALRRACGLNSKHVFVIEFGQCCHIEAVRKEIALRVAEICAIEPDISLIEDAVQSDPPTGTITRGVGAEAMSIHHWPIAGSKLRSVSPVTGHADGSPG